MPRLSDLQRISYPAHPSSVDWSDVGQDFEQSLAEALQRLVRDFEETIIRTIWDSFTELKSSIFQPIRELLELLRLLEQAATDTTAAEQLLARLGIDQGVLAKHCGDPRVVRGYLVTAIKDALTRRDENQVVRVWWQGEQATGRIRPVDLPLPLLLSWLEWRVVATARQWLETLDSELAEPTWAYRRRRRREVSLDEAAFRLEDISVEQAALAAVEAEELVQLLGLIASPQQQRIVELLASGYERPEVATILGLEDSTVRTQLFRLRQKLSTFV